MSPERRRPYNPDDDHRNKILQGHIKSYLVVLVWAKECRKRADSPPPGADSGYTARQNQAAEGYEVKAAARAADIADAYGPNWQLRWYDNHTETLDGPPISSVHHPDHPDYRGALRQRTGESSQKPDSIAAPAWMNPDYMPDPSPAQEMWTAVIESRPVLFIIDGLRTIVADAVEASKDNWQNFALEEINEMRERDGTGQ